MRRIKRRMGWLMALALLIGGAAEAQQLTTRPVRIMVGFPPGGSVDVMARALADGLSPRWGLPVVVENRGGAGGNIASEAVARAAPEAIVAGIHAEVSRILALPATQQRFATLDASIINGGPEQLARMMREEDAKWAPLIRQAGIRPE